jgi:nicotinic acid mononucleotide adenylyltransferase
MQRADGEAGRQEASRYPCLWPTKFSNPKVDLLARRLKRIFESLPHVGYLGSEELADYAYYEMLIVEALQAIDEKARAGLVRALDTREYPKILRYPEGVARVAVYIGTFDPFQLTHLTIALRLLASASNSSDIVIVVPEGSVNPDKPSRTDYPFRYQIARMQIAGLFEPFIIPLDLGANADTIEIVRRLIAMHSGMRLELTHLIGSDALPLAAKFIEEDLAVWKRQAAQSGVDYVHSVHVTRRTASGSLVEDMGKIRDRGVNLYLERRVVGTPSSTDFRQNRAITLVLPTEAIRDKLEILFRYNMNKPWSS